MGQTTKIEWCDHTWNPWRGCAKVSPACDHCYAERQALRNPAVLGQWGDSGTRTHASAAYMDLPYRWNRAARKAGVRRRVFCGSLMDFFEDNMQIESDRRRAWQVIQDCTALDWLLLTKRPKNFARMLPWCDGSDVRVRPHVWLGVTVENQAMADERIPLLLGAPAAVRFLSCEPLVGPISFRWAPWTKPAVYPDGGSTESHLDGMRGIDWVITGGESGRDARPMHPGWVGGLRNQCQAAGVPFFFKQWGEWLPFHDIGGPEGDGVKFSVPDSTPVCLVKPYGRVIRPYCGNDAPGQQMARVGKKLAGCKLDGREWKEIPSPLPF